MENGTQMTFEEYMQETFQGQTAGASDSHVRTFLSQESKLDFKETARACFSELCTLSDNSRKKINPLTFSLRTLRICKQCRIKQRMIKCGLQKRHGTAGKDGSGACLGFGIEWDDEPIEQCKRCIACASFDWDAEKKRLSL